MKLRAYLVGHNNQLGMRLTPVGPADFLVHVQLAHDDRIVLDEPNRKEYYCIKLEEILLQEKRKANEKAAAMLAMEDVT